MRYVNGCDTTRGVTCAVDGCRRERDVAEEMIGPREVEATGVRFGDVKIFSPVVKGIGINASTVSKMYYVPCRSRCCDCRGVLGDIAGDPKFG